MNKLFHLLTLGFCLFSLNACSVSNGHFDVISPHSLSLYTVAAQNKIIAKDVGATSQRHVVVLIPFGRAPNFAEALDEVLNKYQGDYMTDVEITRKTFQLMFWYQYSSWQVEGNVVRVYK